MRRDLLLVILLGALCYVGALAANRDPPSSGPVMVKFVQLKGGVPVWINPSHVAQVRPAVESKQEGAVAIVFGTGTFVEVEGPIDSVIYLLKHD